MNTSQLPPRSENPSCSCLTSDAHPRPQRFLSRSPPELGFLLPQPPVPLNSKVTWPPYSCQPLLHPKLLPPQGDRTESSQYEGHSRGSPSRSWQRRGNLSIPRGRPPTTDPSPTLRDPQGDAWEGLGVEKKRQALLNARILRNHNTLPLSPFLPLMQTRPQAPTAPHSLPLGTPTRPVVFPITRAPPPTTPRAHHQNSLHNQRRGPMWAQGNGRAGLHRQGRAWEGTWALVQEASMRGEKEGEVPSRAFPKGERGMNSLLLGFLLLGTPMARVGSYRISLLCAPRR